MAYKDFRVKALPSVFLMVFFSLLFISGIDLVHAAFIWSVTDIGPELRRDLFKSLAVGLPLLIIFIGFLYWYLSPLHRAFLELSKGRVIDGAQRGAAYKRLRLLRSVLMYGNFCVYGLSALTAVLQGGLSYVFSVSGIIEMVIYLVSAAVAGTIETSIVLNAASEPRHLLEIHYLEKDGTREMGLRDRLILGTFLLVTFVMSFLLFESSAIISKEMRYTHYLESIVSEQMTRTEATEAYRAEGARVMGVDPSFIVFPLDETRDIQRSSRSLIMQLLLICFLMAISYIVQRIVAGETVRQIKDMKTKVDEMLSGAGDLTGRIEITQYDEVGELSSAINSLIESLRKVFLEVRDTSRQSFLSSSELGREIMETSAVTEEMAASITLVAHSVEKKLEEVQSTGQTLEAVFQSLDRITDSVDTQAAFVNETSSSVNEMAANVKSVSQATLRANELAKGLSQAAVEGLSSVTDSVIAIKRIEASSKTVADIISVITKISAQTNLLAMNAAIEAAHAGEAGRGFAVVAEEVRNLAESSAKSAKEIGSHIKAMLEAVKNGVDLSEKAGSTLDRISDDMKSTTDLVREIADAMTEQSLASNEILDSITSLVEATTSIRQNALEQKERNALVRGDVARTTDVFREIVGTTEEQAKGSSLMLKAVEELKSIEMENRELSTRLKKLVEGFKLD